MVANNPSKTRVYDTVIIGAGPGGIYTCDQLEKKGYKGKLCVIERENYVGGRLFSEETWEITRDAVKDELGGMRIFPSVHKEVYKFAKDAGLDVVKIPLKDSNSFFHFRGKTYRKRNVRIPGTGKFANEKVGSIAKAASVNFIQIHGKVEDAYKSPQLKNLSIRDYFKRYGGANDEEVDFWFAYSGYNLYDDDIQVSIYIDDGELYGSDLTHHYFIKQGYAAIVESIRSGLKSPCRFNMNVEKIERRKDGMFILFCSENRKLLTKNVICSLTKYQLMQIQGMTNCISPERLDAIECSKPMPLFKAFLEFSDNWWAKAGLAGQGKTTTDGNCRQIHYYDESDLLIYNSGKYAVYWGKLFEKDPMRGYREMFEEVKRIHQPYCDFEIPEPDWERCSHRFWIDGSHKWKTGCDVRECIDIITNGTKDKIYFTGDAFSDQQGWVQGAMDTSKILIKQFLKEENQHVVELKVGEPKKAPSRELGSYEEPTKDHIEIQIGGDDYEEPEEENSSRCCCC